MRMRYALGVNHELPTLSPRDCGCHDCQTPSREGREERQESDHTGAADRFAAGQKSQRLCKTCGVEVGKGKSFCIGCQTEKRKARLQAKPKGPLNAWAVRDNFKRDGNGHIVEKLCTACNQWCRVIEFTKRSDTASGLRHFCKACEKQYSKRYPQKPAAPKQKECAECGNSFCAKGRSRYCSVKCASKNETDRQRIKANSIHVATHASCRRCGKTKPIADFINADEFAARKIRPWACNECRLARKKRNAKKHKKLRAANPKHKIRMRLSKRFKEVMNKAKGGGSHHFNGVTGCSTAFLRKHLESQFKRGIRWDNYGTKWQVDHILPVSSFDHNDDNQVKKCWHYSNLRPLCAIENNLKSNKITTCQPELLLQLP